MSTEQALQFFWYLVQPVPSATIWTTQITTATTTKKKRKHHASELELKFLIHLSPVFLSPLRLACCQILAVFQLLFACSVYVCGVCYSILITYIVLLPADTLIKFRFYELKLELDVVWYIAKFAKMFSIKEVGDIIVRDILPNGRNRNDKWDNRKEENTWINCRLSLDTSTYYDPWKKNIQKISQFMYDFD